MFFLSLSHILITIICAIVFTKKPEEYVIQYFSANTGSAFNLKKHNLLIEEKMLTH